MTPSSLAVLDFQGEDKLHAEPAGSHGPSTKQRLCKEAHVTNPAEVLAA